MQDRPVGFNVVEYGKFVDAVSDSILQQFLRNYQFTGFGVIFFFLPQPKALRDFRFFTPQS